MLEAEMQAALNKQFNWEQTASHEYLAMAAWFEALSLRGFSKFMRKQSEEEREHAMRLFNHICERGGEVKVGPIVEPRGDYSSPRDVFQAAHAREQSNTKSIHALYRLAQERSDYPTQIMLHWFIDEQVEEEAWCEEALALLDMVDDNKSALLMLDKRYGVMAEAGD
jgi:ferritin